MDLEVIGGTEPDGTWSTKAAELDPRGIKWPAGTTAVIARDENGNVQAISTILVLPHIEGTWVSDEYRKGTLPARLVKKVEDTLREQGGSFVFAFAHDADPQIKSYLERFKYERLPFSIYMKELKAQ